MKRLVSCLLFCGWGALLAGAQGRPTTVDCHVEGRVLAALLELPFLKFDQDQVGGWRQIADKGCRVEAALLIDAYLANPPADLTMIEQGDLYFHAGQLLAMAGENRMAAGHMMRSLNPREPARNELAWNTYVLATIGFLNHDKPMLDSQRQLLAAGEQTRENRINLSVIDGLIHCFDQSYETAYGAACRPKTP